MQFLRKGEAEGKEVAGVCFLIGQFEIVATQPDSAES